MIDELGADLVSIAYKRGETDVVETLSRKQGEYTKTVYLIGDDIPLDTLPTTYRLSEESALKWINDARSIETSELVVKEAGAVIFPDLAKELEEKHPNKNKRSSVKEIGE